MNAVFLRISPVALGLLLCSWESTAQTADLFHRSTLTGDWNGTRNQLENSGIRLTGEYVSELLAYYTAARIMVPAMLNKFGLALPSISIDYLIANARARYR
jgi:hypothetical protein